MPLPTLARWLLAALQHAGNMEQAELARRLQDRLRRSYDRSLVNKMCRGKRKITADELMVIEQITGYPAPNQEIERVPVLDWVSAGKLASAESQIPVGEVPLLAFADLGRGDFFALKVEGDSMDRVSPDGSVIVVNRAEKELIHERCYVFSWRGEATYKLWQPDPPHLAPFSTNPANKPIFVKGKRDFEVVGRVRRTVLDL